MSKQPRPYQVAANDAILAALKRGVSKQLVVMATGTGKSLLGVKVIEPFNKKLWVSHVEELIDQSGAAMLNEYYPGLNIRDMIEAYGGLTDYIRHIKSNPLFAQMSDNEALSKVGIIKADLFDTSSDITLASAQTLYRRLDRMPQDLFDVIVCDEAHLFGSKTFNAPLQYFQPKLLLGLTATPHRMDGMMMGDVFEEIVYQYNISDAIADGYLCEFDAIQCKTQLSLDNVRTTAGELNQKDLRQTVDTPERNQFIVQKYKQYAEGLQNIVYCVDVEHAQNLCQAFKDAGYTADFIVGDAALTTDRKGVVNRFKNKELQILTNVSVLTTGFDYPDLACITTACPTKSMTRFTQIVGRGSRTATGVIDGLENAEARRAAIKSSSKPKCLILDVVDTSSRHKLINTYELDRGKPAEEKTFITSEVREKLIGERTRREFEAKVREDRRINLFELPKAKISTSIRMTEPATEKQLSLIESWGYNTNETNYTKAMASEIITNRPASAKQIGFLKWKGYDVSSGVTMGEATLAFEQIRQREAIYTNSPFNDVL